MSCSQHLYLMCVARTVAVPDRGTFLVMVQREAELEQCAVAQRAFALTCMNRRHARHQLQLRVVREVGLPDTATEVLQNAHFYYPPSASSASSSSSVPCLKPYLHPQHPALLQQQQHCPKHSLAQPLNLHPHHHQHHQQQQASSSSRRMPRSKSSYSCSRGVTASGSMFSKDRGERYSDMDSTRAMSGLNYDGGGSLRDRGCSGGAGAAPMGTMHLDLMYHASASASSPPFHRSKHSPSSASPTSSYSPLEVSGCVTFLSVSFDCLVR
jgi:hypothetical protein